MIKIIFLSYIIFLLTLPPVSFSQWVPQNSGTSQSIRSVDFIDTQMGYAVGNGGVVVKTTNGGTGWQLQNSGTSTNLNSVHAFNPAAVISCGNQGLFIKTTNGGINWFPISGSYPENLFALSFNGLSGICAGSGGHLWTSDGGNTWNIAQQGYLVTYYGAHMVSSLVGYIGGVNSIFSPLVGKTTNGGANWSYFSFYIQNNEATLRDIHFINTSEGFAVSNVWNGQGGISYTTNGGVNWSSQMFTYALLGVDFPAANTGWVVGANGTIMRTTDRGVTWNTQTSGTSSILWGVSFADSLTGYAVGDNGTILKTTNGGVTGIEPISSEITSRFHLYQNFPNPFNPSTKIKFDIPANLKSEVCNLKLYDPLGREIAVLIDDELNPGTYEIEWDGPNHPSGVYFYKLSAGNYSDTKKMLMIK